MSELEQQAIAYHVFAPLRTRIENIRSCKDIFENESKIDLNEIRRQTNAVAPSIMIPILNAFTNEIDRIPDLMVLIQDEIQKKQQINQKIFGQTVKLDGNHAKTIYKLLKKELQEYKDYLLEYESECERLSISSATDNQLQLQWEISLELLCDLFNLLKKKNKLKELNKGELVDFISNHFLVPGSNNKLSKANVRNKISGEIKNAEKLKALLTELIRDV